MMNKIILILALTALSRYSHAQQEDVNQVAIETAQAFFKKTLKDPDSAQFRNIVVRKSSDGKGIFGVCGEINAKNSYGGYVGFRPFYFSGNYGEILSEDNKDVFEMMYSEVVCVSK